MPSSIPLAARAIPVTLASASPDPSIAARVVQILRSGPKTAEEASFLMEISRGTEDDLRTQILIQAEVPSSNFVPSGSKHVCYLSWLVASGVTDKAQAVAFLGATPSVDLDLMLETYAACWENVAATEVDLMAAEGWITTPLVATMLDLKEGLITLAPALQERLGVTPGDTSVLAGPGMNAVESDICRWVGLQDNAATLAGLDLELADKQGFAARAILSHSPLVGTREGLLSLAQQFLSPRTALYVLANPHASSQSFGFLRDYAVNCLMEAKTAHAAVSLATGLASAGYPLLPSHLDQLEVFLATSTAGAIARAYARIPQICSDASLRRLLLSNISPGIGVTVLEHSEGAQWLDLAGSMAVSGQVDSSYFSEVLLKIPSSAAALLTPSWLLTLVSHPDKDVRAAGIALSSRVPQPSPAQPLQAVSRRMTR